MYHRRMQRDKTMIIAVIPAKEESGRLPNKNMLRINGKTLVEHAVEYARSFRRIVRTYVSTDSKEIADHAIKLGVGIIMREKTLTGEAPLIDVYRHAWQTIGDSKITHIVGIQPDNPDRHLNLDEVIQYAIENKIDNLFSVDNKGKRNGAVNILSLNALRATPFVYSSSIQDACTNIHTRLDFLMASKNLSACSEVIAIGERCIGNREPVFVVAEAACNHMCNIDLAKQMIDKAFEAGADAIKFQTYKAERLVTSDAIAFWGEEKISQLEYYRRLDRFGPMEYNELFSYAREKGIIAFSSPFDADNARMLADLDMPVFKIASCEIPNLDFIRLVSSFGKPIIMSTGASQPEEIDEAIVTVYDTGNYQLILLACTLSYPTRNQDAHLNRILAMKERYPGMIIGLSDHTEPDPHMIIPAVGVALGAKVIEKHYTLDRSMTGSGHFFSVNPDELKKMVNNIRLAETVMGRADLGILKAEELARANARRSIVAEVNIPKGQVITSDMLGLKRPADGLPACMIEKVIGKRAKQNINRDQKITFEMLEIE